jgi:carboxyl-terminal processing protease
MGQKLKITGLLSIGALAGAMTTVSLQTVANSAALAPLPLDELNRLVQVFSIVKTKYVDVVDEKQLINAAISGMVSSLDPHSEFLTGKALEQFKEGVSGKFVGVGIEIAFEDGLVRVVSPIEGSPAFRAGLRPGDLVTRIDTTPVKGLTLTEAVKRMRGEPKTKVVLTIFRKDENRSFPVTIIREEIKTVSVRSKVIEPGYAWVRVSQFQENTLPDLVKKLGEVYKAEPNLKGLVLDLRNDPGGLLDTAIGVSAIFLPPKVDIVSTKGQTGGTVYKAEPEAYRHRQTTDPLAGLPAGLKDVPLVVLVNEGSASASEIVAGALQDYKRATIIGNQTFGKGSVQSTIDLSNDKPASLKLTMARYYTPNGRSIQAKGIVPDVLVDETPEGNPYAALSFREADLGKHLANGQTPEVVDPAQEKARTEALQRLEEDRKKPIPDRKPLEFGSDTDFQLQQALNHLKRKPVQVSKTLTIRKEEAPEKN